MNVISLTRALKATNAKLDRFTKARQCAKDKPKWDTRNADKLNVATRQQVQLTNALMGELEKQGQFTHAGYANDEAAAREYYER